jgi:hypothetical protein
MTEPSARHIPADLWLRLAELDACCDVTMARGEWDDPPTGQRSWRVTIAKRGDPPEPVITVVSVTLVDALRIAVAQAQVRGWP